MSNANGITIVGASAGSGKTYRLTEVVSAAIDPSRKNAIGLESLVAVTYTRKAHAELSARIRRTLVSAQAFDEALRLPLAYLGTVHAACLRLLQEFAIDAGLSPNVDVVAEDAGRLLRQSLEASLSREAYANLERLAWRFKLRWQPITKRYEWLGPVSDIMDLARSNRIAPERLAGMAERSAAGLLMLLPMTAERDGDALDDALARELGHAVKALDRANDGVGTTKAALDTLVAASAAVRDDDLDWCTWAKLARVGASRGCDPLLATLRKLASRYEAHPRFRAELSELTLAIFDAARVGLSSYRTWKERRRVVDYVDMLDRVYDLVSHPRVSGELRERLKLAVVDEFQDTSPIQLALFVKLHGLAERSVWVGDRKQCIFEYAGADPRLMDEVAKWVATAGGRQDALSVNYRSRPELVEACSELFAAALAPHGFAREEVVVTAKRETPPELAKLPPFGVWALETKNQAQDAAALASGVARMLADAKSTPVVDRTTKEIRNVRPGDIAVLVATNKEATALADALHACGTRAAIARPGLLATPEGVLMDAALRWLLDEGDSLAAAKIDALLGFGGQTPDAWLDALLPREVADHGSEAQAPSKWRAALSVVRSRLGVLSPSEAVDQVLAALDVVHLCARWPDGPQRVANLDALRGIASGYEDRCDQEREAGTVAGLLRYFDDIGTEKLRRDEVIASDDQHIPTDDGAVIVCTYHRSKGLEWPVVVLSSLDRGTRRDAFEVCPESDGEVFDPQDPLAGRWIRYWPWPVGSLERVPLADYAAASEEGKRVAEREEKERARLLYVGFTRARDHLVLAARVKTVKATKKLAESRKADCEWLDELADGEGEPLVVLPVGGADGARDVVTVRSGKGSRLEVPARVWCLNGAAAGELDEVDATTAGERRWFARPDGAMAPACGGPTYGISPSNAHADWPELELPSVGEIVTLPGAMPIDGNVAAYDKLGDAVHAFFASDLPGASAAQRVERAGRLLASSELVGVVRPEALLEASDRLRTFVDERWPGAVWHREVAIDTHVASADGRRRVVGIIDLLLETDDGYVVFDHKTFPGRSEASWRAKVVELLPQFAAYGAALGSLTGRKVLGGWVHLPVSGALVALRMESDVSPFG